VTGNVLIEYEQRTTGVPALLNALHRLELDGDEAPDERPAPPVVREKGGPQRRARIAVRGLDRDPELARRVVERLESRPGVRARSNPLTGRVLVEYDER
jgi:hypothetical protein